MDGRSKDQHYERRVEAGDGPDLWPRKGSEIELQADHEQQQGDAEVRQLLEHFPACISVQVQHEVGRKEADQGWQPERL